MENNVKYYPAPLNHLDSKPKAPEKKRGRGEKDLPHIVSQLRGVVDTKDGKPSAHFEHSIAICEDEVRVLTK